MAGEIYWKINGVLLDNPTFGWSVKRGGTNAMTGVTKRTTAIVVPGWDGYIPAPNTYDSPTVVLVVQTPRVNLETLLALVTAPVISLTNSLDATKEAICELQSAIPNSVFDNDRLVKVTITLTVPGGKWRDTAAIVSGPTTISSSSQTINLLTGISAPIRDMDIFLRGDFGNFQLTDSSGSYLKTVKSWTGSSTTGLLYNGSSGQAWLANESSPWTPVSDASEYIDVSGGGGFWITSTLVGGAPDNRRATLVLQTTSQTDVTLRVRAKNGYLFG